MSKSGNLSGRRAACLAQGTDTAPSPRTGGRQIESRPGLIMHRVSFLICCYTFVHSVLGLEGPPLLDAPLLPGEVGSLQAQPSPWLCEPSFSSRALVLLPLDSYSRDTQSCLCGPHVDTGCSQTEGSRL